MLGNYLPFYEISSEIERVARNAEIFKTIRSELSEDEEKAYTKLLKKIQVACAAHGLVHTAEMAKRAAQKDFPTYDSVYHSLIHLNDSLASELEREAIVRIAPDQKSYYEQGELFGAEVTAAFPGRVGYSERGKLFCVGTGRRLRSSSHAGT